MRFIILAFLTALSVPAIASSAPRPAEHGDFSHYTFALTWQPGICTTDEGCLPNQPRSPLIGLHGLWASRPQALIRSGITDRTWWSRGCDYYARSTAAPPIGSRLRQTLESVMPHFEHDLLVHEYDKHVRCFGFDATAFFTTELRMRQAVAESAFGRYLVSEAGNMVTHVAVTTHFASAFSTDKRTSLQLQCGRDSAGRTVLTQFWITIRTAELGEFPKPSSLMNALTDQDTCPAVFRVPAWRPSLMTR
jgi:ribonuclease I